MSRNSTARRTERSQEGETGGKEIFATQQADEICEVLLDLDPDVDLGIVAGATPGCLPGPLGKCVALRGRIRIAPCVPDHRVRTAAEVGICRSVQPVFLYELELANDVRLVAHEEQSDVVTVVVSDRPARDSAIPVIVVNGMIGARVRLADVGAERTTRERRHGVLLYSVVEVVQL